MTSILDIGWVSQEIWQNPYSPVQPHGHWGTDIAAPTGTPIPALANGVVVFADWGSLLGPNLYGMIAFHPGSGILVIIDHGDWYSLYAHLDKEDLEPGQQITEGQTIGYVGSTGNSTGPHVHLETFTDPVPQHGTYGRFDPRTKIRSKLPKKVGFLMALSDAQQENLYAMVKNLHDDQRQGIIGVQSDGNSFAVIRAIAAKAGVKIDEQARRRAHGKRKAS
ncbi:M23 family metallopeptidase [Arthrobacter sp. HLT1-21]